MTPVADPWNWTSNDGPPSHLIFEPLGGVWKRPDIKWDVSLDVGTYPDAISRHGSGSSTWTGFVVYHDEDAWDQTDPNWPLKPGRLGRAYAYDISWYTTRDYVTLKIIRRGKLLMNGSVPLHNLIKAERRGEVAPGASMRWLESLIDPVTGDWMNDIIWANIERLEAGATASDATATDEDEARLDAVPADGPGMSYDDLAKLWGITPRRAHAVVDDLLGAKWLREGSIKGARGQSRKAFWRAE